jgi:hypothetical protein
VTTSNADLTDEQKERGRIVWLLREACKRAGIPTTTGNLLIMSGHVQDLMHENQMLMVWVSDLEAKMTDG